MPTANPFSRRRGCSVVDLRSPLQSREAPTSGTSKVDSTDRFAPGHARWLLSAVLWLTLVFALASLHPLFQGAVWWFVPALVSAAVLAASAAARAAHWPSAVASLAGLVVGGLATTLVVSGGTAILGVIPTAETLERVRVLAAQAQDSIVSDQAPIAVSDAMLGVVVVAVAAAAVVLDVVARVCKMPALTGVLFAVVIVVPSLIPDVAPSWAWVVATVVGYLALLIVSSGRRPSRAGVVSGLAAVVVAGVVTSLLPTSLIAPITGVGSGTGISTGVNPVINLGDDLRRGDPITVLSYRSSAPEGDYLKLVDLVDFSGTRWSPASTQLDRRNSVDDLPAAPGISTSTRRDTVTTDVSVNLLRSPYLPLPVPATKITGISDAWKYVDDSGVTVRSTSEGSQGLDYRVTSRPVDPTREQIVSALAQPSDDLSAYLDVDGVPASITRLASRVTADSANPFDAAVALQNYFRNGEFSYSEDTPVREGYDGSGLDMVETFLQRKSGYCVHFASAMAVMARTLDIPSRIAVGFLPGTRVGSGEEWTVSSNDLHTWPELYFQGLGWVPFEPTVGMGTTSSYLQETGAEATPSAGATDPASPSASATPTASAPSAATPTSTASDPSSTAGASASSGAGGIGGTPLAVGGVAALVVVLALPWWLRMGRRRRRLGQGPPDAALSAWREVIDTARDLGISVDQAATPQQTATVLLASVGAQSSAAAALDTLTAALSRERFGGVPAGEEASRSAREILSALRSGSSGFERARASVVPRSLFVQAHPRTAEGA